MENHGLEKTVFWIQFSDTMYLYVQFPTDLLLHKYMHGEFCRMIVFYLCDLHRVQNRVLRDRATCAEFFKWL